MKFLVTGGAGFIGSHLVEYLIAAGKKVICLDNFDDFYDPRLKWENISAVSQDDRFELVEGDIRSAELVNRVIRENEIEVVLHLAARAGVRPSIQDPLIYEDINVKGTLNLLEACRQSNVRKFIFASSSSVYGNCKKVPFSEDERLDTPISPYAATKKAAELFCHTYHYMCGLPITCLRFFTVYGPRQRPEMAIHKFTRLIAAGEMLPVFGDGRSGRDYTFITDIVDGVMRAVERCEGFHIYNLGGSSPIELGKLIGLIESNLKTKARLEYLPEQTGEVRLTCADVERSSRELGYKAKVGIDEGVKLFIGWYKQRN